VSVRWTWAQAPDEALSALAGRLAEGWTPGDSGLLKRGAGRAVWRVPVEGGALLLKHFVVPPARRPLHLLRASRAAAEYRAALAYAAAGVPTALPVGFGERCAAGLLREAYYLGRFLEQAVTLGDWLRECALSGRSDALQIGVDRALALVAQMHEVPLRHRDLHANNLLRTPDGSLSVIDLHSAWRVPRVTRAIRVENLSRLIFSIREFVDLRSARDLLRTYEQAAGVTDAAFVGTVEQALARFESDYVRGRTARCLKRSSLFDATAHVSGRLFRRRDYTAEHLDADTRAHRAVLSAGGADVLGSAPRTRVTRVGPQTRAVVIKEYLPTGIRGALRQALGGGLARSAWVGARLLEVLEIPTPEARALLERRDGSAVLVTREAPEVLSLRTFAERLEPAAGARDRSDVARQVGWLVGRLSRAGVRHDDLSTKNVLLQRAPPARVRDVRDRPPDGAWRALLIDLDNMRPMPSHDEAGLERMLTQLFDVPAWITRCDRRRFERAYEFAAGRPLQRSVADAALAGAAARARRREQQSRPRPEEAARLGHPHAPAPR
jgi:tRNA A-37 threonylcarbamoyl transferase component Bud32